MHKKSKKQSLPPIVIIILTLVIGFIIWLIYFNKNAANTSTSAANTSQTQNAANYSTDTNSTTQTDPNEGYVTIDEWGVRFKPVEGLLTPVYFKMDNSTNSLNFSIQEIIDIEPNCTDGFLTITRRSEPSDNFYESLVATINGYYYYKEDANAACSQNEANYDFEIQQSNLLKESVMSLDAME